MGIRRMLAEFIGPGTAGAVSADAPAGMPTSFPKERARLNTRTRAVLENTRLNYAISLLRRGEDSPEVTDEALEAAVFIIEHFKKEDELRGISGVDRDSQIANRLFEAAGVTVDDS